MNTPNNVHMHKYDTATEFVTWYPKIKITQIFELSKFFVTLLTCKQEIKKQKITTLQTAEKITIEIYGPGLLWVNDVCNMVSFMILSLCGFLPVSNHVSWILSWGHTNFKYPYQPSEKSFKIRF